MVASPELRGADLVVRALQRAGVDTIFSLSGNQIMPIYDAVLGSGIRIIHVRHEAAAVFMAEGYAQATGRVGVALLTAGPGFASGLSAAYSAKTSETPVLLLTGDAPLAQAGHGAFQELDQARVAGPLTKTASRAGDGVSIDEAVSRAIELALAGRPGPVHLALPFDAVNARVPEMPKVTVASDSDPLLSEADATTILGHLRGAARPIILAGPVFCRAVARDTVQRLREASGAPVVAMESPRGLRDPRLGAFADVLPRADLLVTLGKPLDFQVGFGQPPSVAAGCRFIAIDADDAALDRARLRHGTQMIATHHAEPRAAAETLVRAAAGSGVRDGGWRAEVEDAVRHRPAAWNELKDIAGPSHPVVVARAVAAVLRRHPDAILVVDGGEFGQWMQACLDAPLRIINGPSGAIGGGIGYAIGAKAAHPGRPVIALMGDGTAGFHFLEFETAVRNALPFVAIVGNDARWNAEHQIQLRDYGPDRTHACELLPIRYDQVAATFGGHGAHVATAADLEPAIMRALASRKPACINVALDGLPAPVVRLA